MMLGRMRNLKRCQLNQDESVNINKNINFNQLKYIKYVEHANVLWYFLKNRTDNLWRVLKNQLDLKPTTYKDQIFIQMNDREVFLHKSI